MEHSQAQEQHANSKWKDPDWPEISLRTILHLGHSAKSNPCTNHCTVNSEAKEINKKLIQFGLEGDFKDLFV